MRKQEQIDINEIAMNIYKDAMIEFHNGIRGQFYRVDNCQAWYVYTDNFVLLRSYNTFVAVYDMNTGDFADVIRVVYGYTATSAKHIAKFRHLFPHLKEYTARNV